MAAPLAIATPSRLRVHLLADPKPTDRGVVYRRGGQRYLLAWPRVRRAFAAAVGETERAGIEFHLVVESRGAECVSCRVELAPGEAAHRLARALVVADEEGVGECVRSLARDGVASRRHPDPEAFADAVLEAVRFDPD